MVFKLEIIPTDFGFGNTQKAQKKQNSALKVEFKFRFTGLDSRRGFSGMYFLWLRAILWEEHGRGAFNFWHMQHATQVL